MPLRILAKPLIGGMPELPVVGPAAQGDLGYELGLDPAIALLTDGHGQRRFFDDELVHLPPERGAAGLGEAGADASDINETIAFSRCQQEPADAAKCNGRRLVADDGEALRLDAFDLKTVAAPAGAIRG